MWNVHMHRNPETLTTLGSSGTKLLLSSWLLGFRHEEREIQFLLCWLFHLTQQRAAHHIDPNWTGLVQLQISTRLAQLRISTSLPQVQISTNCFFSKITKIPSTSLPGITSFASLSHFLSRVFIMTSVIVTSSARGRKHLRSMCVPARALSRIVLSLTKPNDKNEKW